MHLTSTPAKMSPKKLAVNNYFDSESENSNKSSDTSIKKSRKSKIDLINNLLFKSDEKNNY